jgi:hypothetical protein
MISAIVAYTKKAQSGRLAGRPKEVREQMTKALSELSPATLKIKLLPESPLGGDRVLYTH